MIIESSARSDMSLAAKSVAIDLLACERQPWRSRAGRSVDKLLMPELEGNQQVNMSQVLLLVLLVLGEYSAMGSFERPARKTTWS